MTEYTLKEYLDTCTQAEAALKMQRTQGAISQMLKSGRDIRIRVSDLGDVSWYEIRKPKKVA